MKMRKVLAFGLASSIALSLAACTSSETQSMVQAIDENKPIEISVEQMTPESLSGSNLTELTWVPLGQLKTYNMGFRQAFDSVFNINITMESSSDTEGSKQGCLYVVNEDGRDIHSGNTTLYDAFRNKVFIEDYWNRPSKKMELAELCEEIYTDIDRNSNYAVNAALNAYYNLTQDGENPGSYNATDILSREEFYTMLLKATTPVYEITDSQDFESKMGTGTEYTKYASQIAQYGWLQAGNNSLDSYTISEPITVVEVIYTLVQMFFPDEYAAMTDESPNYSDIPAGGDLALRVGFKEEVEQAGSDTTTVVAKDRWQSYILAYMLQNKDRGFQSELYRAMAVAKQMGIIAGNTSMWDKTVNKNDALVLIENTFLALNKTQGYLTTSEYAEIVHSDDEDNTSGNNSSVIDIDDLFGNNSTNENTDVETENNTDLDLSDDSNTENTLDTDGDTNTEGNTGTEGDLSGEQSEVTDETISSEQTADESLEGANTSDKLEATSSSDNTDGITESTEN